MLTGRWFWCDRTQAQSLVSSFDQGEVIWLRPDTREESDRTLRASVWVNSSKVSERKNHDWPRPVTT